MTSRITLYSDETLIRQIKQYAKDRNTSVSKIVNQFFTNLINTPTDHHSRHRLTDNLTGILTEDEADAYGRYLEEKYL